MNKKTAKQQKSKTRKQQKSKTNKKQTRYEIKINLKSKNSYKQTENGRVVKSSYYFGSKTTAMTSTKTITTNSSRCHRCNSIVEAAPQVQSRLYSYILVHGFPVYSALFSRPITTSHFTLESGETMAGSS